MLKIQKWQKMKKTHHRVTGVRCIHLWILAESVSVLSNFKCRQWSSILKGINFKRFLKENYAIALDSWYLSTEKMLDMEFNILQKQPSRGVHRKRCSKNMQHIYRRTPVSKCDFNKVTKQLCTSAWGIL